MAGMASKTGAEPLIDSGAPSEIPNPQTASLHVQFERLKETIPDLEIHDGVLVAESLRSRVVSDNVDYSCERETNFDHRSTDRAGYSYTPSKGGDPVPFSQVLAFQMYLRPWVEVEGVKIYTEREPINYALNVVIKNPDGWMRFVDRRTHNIDLIDGGYLSSRPVETTLQIVKDGSNVQHLELNGKPYPYSSGD